MHPHFKATQIVITVVGLLLLITLILCHVYLKRPKVRDLVLTLCAYLAFYIIYRGFFHLRQIQSRRRTTTPLSSPPTGVIPMSFPTYADYRNSNLPALRPIPETQIPVLEVEEETVPPSYNMAVTEPVPSYRSASNLSIQLSHNP
ncbi:hypothetical protein K7432_011511 [Basidiobolus ranarum]|uniref:Uncharacterized protein n=1 Tax=Basidiobolus ranarum TaxID=34480 RepID=A0ABR2WM37_9FUNG